MRTNRALISVALAALLVVAAATPASAGDDPAPDPRAQWWTEKTTGVQVNGTYTPIAGEFATTNAQKDIIWYAPGAGVEQVWISLNDGTFAKQPLQQQVNGTYEPIVGDFSGDGLDDIFWYGYGSATDNFWKSTSSHTFQSYPVNVGGEYYPVVLHDDGSKDDILWWKPAGFSPLWSFTGNGTDHTSTTLTAPSNSAGPTVGDFNGDGNDDVFWYAVGTAADRLDFSNGSGAFVKVAQAVTGTYVPIVGPFTQGGSTDDIVWFKFSGGAMPYWTFNADGSYSKLTVNIPVANANPLSLVAEWGYLHLWTEGGTDYIWYDDGPTDVFQTTGNTSMPAGSRPIPRAFVGLGTDIFWYRPGAATDRLFYA